MLPVVRGLWFSGFGGSAMTHDHDEVSHRPSRVIILDADDPMVEIHGRFVWQDEHERVLAEIAQRAYADGYEAGRRDARAPVEIRLRRRRGLLGYVWLFIVCLGALVVLLFLPVVLF